MVYITQCRRVTPHIRHGFAQNPRRDARNYTGLVIITSNYIIYVYGGLAARDEMSDEPRFTNEYICTSSSIYGFCVVRHGF